MNNQSVHQRVIFPPLWISDQNTARGGFFSSFPYFLTDFTWRTDSTIQKRPPHMITRYPNNHTHSDIKTSCFMEFYYYFFFFNLNSVPKFCFVRSDLSGLRLRIYVCERYLCLVSTDVCCEPTFMQAFSRSVISCEQFSQNKTVYLQDNLLNNRNKLGNNNVLISSGGQL